MGKVRVVGGVKSSPSSLGACTWLLRRLLISPCSRLVFMNVGDVPDTNRSPSSSLILQHVSTLFFFLPSFGSADPAGVAHPRLFLTRLSIFAPFFLSFFLLLPSSSPPPPSSSSFPSPRCCVFLLRDAAAGPDVLTLTLWIRVNIFSPGRVVHINDARTVSAVSACVFIFS